MIFVTPPNTKINRKVFFDSIRHLFKGVSAFWSQGVDAILDEWERRDELTDLRWLAYILATAYHETGRTMQPVREWKRGEGKKYGVRDSVTGQVYYGRGHVQLTWPSNYRKMGKILGIDLYHNPDLALQMDVSVKIMFEGMLRAESKFGDFTGKCLEMYFNDNTEEWVNARQIINGTDKAGLIAAYGHEFYNALIQATKPTT